MLYFDTSFLAPLVLPESTSDKIAAFVRRLPVEELTVSHWTRVEFSSLIARDVRMSVLDAAAGARADARFEAMVDASLRFCFRTPMISDSPSGTWGNSIRACGPETPCILRLPAIVRQRRSIVSTRAF